MGLFYGHNQSGGLLGELNFIVANTTGFSYDVWADENYIYAAGQAAGMYAYSFNGTAFTEIDTDDQGGSYLCVWSDGSYIYTGGSSSSGSRIVRAYSFNGTTLTHITSIDLGGSDTINRMHGDGTYIYAIRDAGMYALSFNGSSFTNEGNIALTGTLGQDVKTDGTYIYRTRPDKLEAFSFSGGTFTLEGTKTYSTYNAYSLDISGSYIYAGAIDSTTGKLYSYTFNGTTFTDVDNVDTATLTGALNPLGTHVKDNYVLTCHQSDGLTLSQTSSGNLTLKDTDDPGTYICRRIWANTNYVFVGTSTRLLAYEII